ncbi:hypothetical protein LUZ60_012896 [Juncus effusus]|nr:hypothetical protein LUZ60_012896 [Juncus effusus]
MDLAEGKDEVQVQPQIYHERQKLQFCLLHALNNLFQENDSFSRVELNNIAEKLEIDDPNKQKWSPLSVIFKPHYNKVSGNYDVNVLMATLESRKKKVVWHDRRNGASSIDLDGESLMGIMLNTSVKKYRGLWNGRHWLALRNIDGLWYNLDSHLTAPLCFEDKQQLVSFVDDIVSQGGEVFLVLHDKLQL